MFRPIFRALLAAMVLIGTATPAAAQIGSDSYLFVEAVRDKDLTKVFELLDKAGSQIIDSKDAAGEGAIHIVTKTSNLSYLRLLLQRDADPDLQDRNGNTALTLAATQGWLEGAQTLITYKAAIDLPNRLGETPLIRAVQQRNLPMVRLLLSKGADPDKTDFAAGLSARDYARRDRRAQDILREIEDAPKGRRNDVSGPRL